MTPSPASLLLLALPLLGGGCLIESKNVGDTPAPGESEPGATETEGQTGMAESATGVGDTDVMADTGVGDTGVGETGVGDTDFEETDFGKPEACLDMEYDCFFDDYQPVECGSKPACDVLMVDQSSGGADTATFVNPEVATCILDGLAAGTPGLYQVRVDLSIGIFVEYDFEVLASGSVLARSEFADDKVCDGTDRRLALRGSDHFTGCQALGSDPLVMECLLDVGTLDACTTDSLCN